MSWNYINLFKPYNADYKMYLVRNIFYVKPGHGKAFLKIFKEAAPLFNDGKMKNNRVLVDAVTTFWTVVFESEVESIDSYRNMRPSKNDQKIAKIMKNYAEHLNGGKREIFKVE